MPHPYQGQKENLEGSFFVPWFWVREWEGPRRVKQKVDNKKKFLAGNKSDGWTSSPGDFQGSQLPCQLAQLANVGCNFS